MNGRRHTLADHRFGAEAGHSHAPGEADDHDHDGDDGLVAEGSRELEEIPLLTVGVDVGSASVQVVVSRLAMRGPGEPLAMRRQAKARETLHLSPILPTPFENGRIDAARLRAIVDRALAAAGVTPDDVDAGVVLLTGAAARHENAAAIVETLAEDIGDLVSAAAGDRLEAMLAAHGSGAVARSRAEGSRLLSVDIGGATTKIALVDAGQVVAATALPVGARQAAFDFDGRVTRLDPEAARWAQRAGVSWTLGGRAEPAEMQAVAEAMAAEAADALRGAAPPERLLLPPLPSLAGVQGAVVSGGVAEYVHGRETRDFGDLGWRLGRALRRRWDAGEIPIPLLEGGEGIRATALGASQFSVQMSGRTSFITAPAALLPRRNLPVVSAAYDFSGAVDPAALAAAIRARRALCEDDDPRGASALALRWRGEPSHARLLAAAQGVAAGLADRIAAGAPLYLLLEGDVAANLGAVLREECGVTNDILALDGVALRAFDRVDIGRLRLPSGMIPLTVKTLLFPTGR
ncbi:MAG TPA: ethanolamine ammonia-lyase reactivating factor EutA [Beijerinckiaceae bacterium]